MSPAGVVHYRYWKTAWFIPLLTAFFALWLVRGWVMPLGIILGYGLGYFIDPDLDLVSMSSAEGRMLQIPILGVLWVTYWMPYGATFRRHHRSFWTHSYVVSTLIRFAYQFWPLLLLRYWSKWIGLVMVGLFIGLAIADAIHVWADRKFGGK